MSREQINLGPHVGIIRFNVFVHKMLHDGSIDPLIVDCSSEFKDCAMTNLGEIHVVGFDKYDCVKKIKERLEILNG